MSLNLFLTLAALAIGLLVYYVKRKYEYWKDRGFVSTKVDFPYGSIKGAGSTIHFSQVMQKIYTEYGNNTKAVGLYFFISPIMLVTDLELVKHVLVKDFGSFHDRGVYYCKETDPLSAHMFALEGAEWKQMRTKLTPTFTSGKMKMMFNTVKNVCQEMIDFMNKNENSVEIELNDILGRFTTDVIGNVAFGLDINSMKNPESKFREMGKKFFNPSALMIMKSVFMTSFKELSLKLKLKVTDAEVSDFFISSVRQNIEYRETNNINRDDFFNLLLQIKNKGKVNDDSDESLGNLTVEELAAQAFLFFLAGFETSSSAMTFALYELALNQDIQDKLREEIQSTISNHNNEITYESMIEMKYLQMVIDETLRKFPPLDNLLRTPSHDYKIPNTDLVIEKGVLTVVSIYAIHMDPKLYPDPEKFDPERFSEENKKNCHPMAHIPFGEGPRNCIGSRFGFMQTKIGLIMLLMNFKFSPSPKTLIPMEIKPNAGFIRPKNDMWLKVEKL